MPPSLVTLPGRTTTPRRKPRGRDLSAVLAAAEAALRDAAIHRNAQTVTLRGKPHMAYDTQDPHRCEHARHLNARARKIVGVTGFGGYFASRS